MAIKFDDSIIEDKESESARALRELSAGVISEVEYRTRIFGETEEIAKKKLEEVAEEDELEQIIKEEDPEGKEEPEKKEDKE